MQNLPGNPNNYPANIRSAAGSDFRNATTEAATASDLADRTAYLYSRAALGFYAGLCQNISDINTVGPNPQTVDNTPRLVCDSTGAQLVLSGITVAAGDRLLVNVGPLLVQPRYASQAVVQVSIGSKSYRQVFDSITSAQVSAGAVLNYPFQCSFLHTAIAAGAISISLYAWMIALASGANVAINSPCNSAGVKPYGWPNDGTTGTANQLWCSVIHFGAGT